MKKKKYITTDFVSDHYTDLMHLMKAAISISDYLDAARKHMSSVADCFDAMNSLLHQIDHDIEQEYRAVQGKKIH